MNRHTRVWPLQEAKAKFSELVRRAQTEGPQTVTVHGQAAVVVTAAPHEKKLIAGKYEPTGTGLDLVRALSEGPPFDLEIPLRPLDSAPMRNLFFDED